MRGIAGTRRVGHLGTLDPIATGVLPVMIGQATRLAQFWDNSEKAYEAVVKFGFATTTFDRQGDPVGEMTQPRITVGQIEACIVPMRGQSEQTPPPVSAKKINGVPAYKLVRKNVPVELAPVKVTIYELTLVELKPDGASATLRVRCSAGTYIRTIAHQLGILLGCGAHVDALVRTRSGPFAIENAFTLEQLQERKNKAILESALLPAAELLPQFPAVFVDEITASQIRQGRNFNASPFRANAETEYVKAIGPGGNLVAIGRIALPHVYHPVVVLN